MRWYRSSSRTVREQRYAVRPFAIEVMLRIHYLQQWFGLSDPAMEEALHDVPLYREFAGLGDVSRLPDETTILRLRYLLEAHDLAVDMLRVVNEILQAKGLLLSTGTAVDAPLIAAPSSTKNAQGSRGASDQEGQPVVLRHECPHRCGRRGWCTRWWERLRT